MSINSSALIRFQKYDECLSSFQSNFTKEDILDKLRKTESLQRKTSRNGIQRLGIEVNDRQFYKDLKTIEKVWKIKIDRIKLPKGKKIYRYSREDFSIFANRSRDNNYLLKLRDTLFVLQQFKGLPQFEFLIKYLDENDDFKPIPKRIVQFDENLNRDAFDHYLKILKAIQLKRVLRVTYNESFRTKKTNLISPYFLKEYNNRWFLLCSNVGYKSISNYALDRIEAIEDVDSEKYVETNVDFDDGYFDDVVGVTVNEGDPVDIVLKFSPKRLPYVVSKPLHESQKPPSENHTIKITVIPNLELTALILHYGSEVEVLEPESLREEIRGKISMMNQIYEKL